MAVDASASAETLKGNPPSHTTDGGQEKMAKEVHHPGATSGDSIWERLKNLRVSRRKALTGAASIGVGVAAVVGLDKVGLLKKEEDAVTERSVPNIFESVRGAISVASGSEELRTKLLDRVSEYERVNNILNEIRQAHESFVEPDGTPTLVAQTRSRLFGKADMTAFWKGKYATEKEFIEAQVDILAPLRYQKVLIEDFFKELANSPDKGSLIAFDGLLDANKRRSDLPKVGYLPPGSKQGVTMHEFEQAFRDVMGIGTEVPKKGQIEVKPAGPIPANVQSVFEQDRQKVLSRIGNLPFPEDIIVILSSSRYGIPLDPNSPVSWNEAGGVIYQDDEGKTVLSVQTEFNDYSAVVHEVGHYFRHKGRFLRPRDLIAYEIAVEKVLSDPKIGRNYPDISLLFNKERQNAVGTTDLDFRFSTNKNPDLFRYSTGDYPDSVWIRQARQGPLTGDDGIFGDVLPYRMVDSFSKQTPMPFEGFDYEFNFSKFVAAEKVHFDQLAASDPVWAYVVGEIRKNPRQFDYAGWAGVRPGRIGAEIGTLPAFGTKGIDYASYWKSVVTFGQAILADGFFRNEPVVMQALSKLKDGDMRIPRESNTEHGTKERFINLWSNNLMGQCDEEKWAETFNLATSHPELLPTGTSFNAFFNMLRNVLRPSVAQVLPNQR